MRKSRSGVKIGSFCMYLFLLTFASMLDETGKSSMTDLTLSLLAERLNRPYKENI
jgi:hypothetical protein